MRVKSAEKSAGFDVKLSLDIAGNNGNTQKVKAGLGARVQEYKADGTWFGVLNAEYGESADVKDTDKTFFHFRHIWYLDTNLALEAFTQLESNEFTRLKLRALAGAGVRWQVLNNPNHSAYIGLGLFRSKEELDPGLLVTDAGVVYNNRLNGYLVYKLAITDHSRFVNTIYYQPDINETSDYRLLEQFGLQLDITDNLSFKLSVDVAHDSEAPQQIEPTDTSYNTGFEYRF